MGLKRLLHEFAYARGVMVMPCVYYRTLSYHRRMSEIYLNSSVSIHKKVSRYIQIYKDKSEDHTAILTEYTLCTSMPIGFYKVVYGGDYHLPLYKDTTRRLFFISSGVFIFQIFLLLSTSTSSWISALYTESTKNLPLSCRFHQNSFQSLGTTRPKQNDVEKHAMKQAHDQQNFF
jgi:hypothetical protein